jgi:hypothetical protein
MRKKTDWMARSHEGLYSQANQTVGYFTPAVLTRIGVAGAALTWYQDIFVPKHTKFNSDFENWQNPAERTPVKTAALRISEKDFRKAYRQFYTGYLKDNPLVTDEDLVAAGLPPHPSGGSKPAPDPSTLVETTTDTSIPGTVIIHFRDKDSTGTGKPDGVHGMEIVYEVLDEPPADWSELKNSSFFTHTPAKLTFSGKQRGKRLFYAPRWENTRGIKGPWNDINDVIIP